MKIFPQSVHSMVHCIIMIVYSQWPPCLYFNGYYYKSIEYHVCQWWCHTVSTRSVWMTFFIICSFVMFHSSRHSKCCNPCILHCSFLLIFRCFNRDPNWSHTPILWHLMSSCSNDGHKGSIAQGTALLLPFNINLLLDLSSPPDYHAGTCTYSFISLSPFFFCLFLHDFCFCLSLSLFFIYTYCTSTLLIVLAALCVSKDLVLRLSFCPSFIYSVCLSHALLAHKPVR